MIKIGICDDSDQIVIKMSTIVKNFFFARRVEHSINCYTSGLKLLKDNIEFDIVFLGIEVEQINRIGIAKQLRVNNPKIKIIYVPNYRDYQTSASEVHAFQYITKPLSEKKVCEVIDEALKYIEHTDKRDIFTFCSDKGFIKLRPSDILYLEFKNRKVNIITSNHTYSINSTMCKVYDELKCYGFGVPHKSFIVNFQSIHSIKGYEIKIRNGEVVPMAQRRAVEFKKVFFDYLNETYHML
ncbi:LytR/AlgR family response regulator transcription factor [Paenibacillus sonchi]|uniref:LytR/AlgR family response regulator transcription factor n=1 Tax=Paenibacillus sonchi TaxID=373687 RepID=UPI0022B90E97|nr:LytTR family DNA-binding domain-containing protein [Paenibacillus sonchi]